MRTITLSFALFLAAMSAAMAGPFEDGMAAYKKGDWGQAYAQLSKFADTKALSPQIATAQERLGRLTEHGKGTAKDFAAAAKWYERAALQDNLSAQARLGQLYRLGGPGLPRDPLQASKWSVKAASQGNGLAQTNLGYMTLDGVNGPADPTAAAGWFKRAADQGDPNGMLALGTLLESGKGTPKDLVQAARWYMLASVDDGENDAELFERAKQQRDTLAKSLSPAQIAQAEKLAKDFKPVAKR